MPLPLFCCGTAPMNVHVAAATHQATTMIYDAATILAPVLSLLLPYWTLPHVLFSTPPPLVHVQ